MRPEAIEGFKQIREREHPAKLYVASIAHWDDQIFFLIRENLEQKLVILAPRTKSALLSGFAFEETGQFEYEGKVFKYLICPCNHQNATALRKVFRFTNPVVVGLAPAIGTGDRIGLATPGHIRALKGLNVFPVLAQQSVREMDRTKRTPKEVLDTVSWAVFQEGYRNGFGADADHVKTMRDLDVAFKAGFTMYTIDPSDHVDSEADNYDLEELGRKAKDLPWKELECTKQDYLRLYLGKKLRTTLTREGKIDEFSEEVLLRAAVKYSAAIAHTIRMYRHLERLLGEREFDFEMSVDETETPTSLPEHFFIVSELRRLRVRITGLALRFVGRFEKAVDYIGNPRQFEESFKEHLSLARAYGPYKLSIHSGSDKFSIYPVIGGLGSDIIHLKTAGMSYLEALRVVARHDPALFRSIVEYGFKCFDRDRRSYYVSTNLSLVPDPKQVSDESLERMFLDEDNARQLLHITYGSILSARKSGGEWLFREQIRKVLVEHEEEHYETVARHIRRHAESIWLPQKRNKPSMQITDEKK